MYNLRRQRCFDLKGESTLVRHWACILECCKRDGLWTRCRRMSWSKRTGLPFWSQSQLAGTLVIRVGLLFSEVRFDYSNLNIMNIGVTKYRLSRNKKLSCNECSIRNNLHNEFSDRTNLFSCEMHCCYNEVRVWCYVQHCAANRKICSWTTAYILHVGSS